MYWVYFSREIYLLRCNIIDKKKLSINTNNRYANENLVPTYEEVMIARGSSINVVGSKTIITSDSAVVDDLLKNK